MSDLKGKTAIVTGGSRDIGRSCCVKLGEQGCNVVVNYNSNQAAAEETVSAVEAAGGKAIAV